MIINNGTYYVTLEFFPEMKSLQKAGLNFCIWPNFVHCLIGILASTTTMVYLIYKRSKCGGVEVSKRNWRSCVTIFIMNIPYLMTVVTILNVKLFLPTQVSFREILFAWLPFCTSGLNPLIIISRMKSVRGFIRVRIERMIGREVESVEFSLKGKSPVLQRARDMVAISPAGSPSQNKKVVKYHP